MLIYNICRVFLGYPQTLQTNRIGPGIGLQNTPSPFFLLIIHVNYLMSIWFCITPVEAPSLLNKPQNQPIRRSGGDQEKEQQSNSAYKEMERKVNRNGCTWHIIYFAWYPVVVDKCTVHEYIKLCIQMHSTVDLPGLSFSQLSTYNQFVGWNNNNNDAITLSVWNDQPIWV